MTLKPQPNFAELGLMLDIGRKRFSPKVLLSWVDAMAECGYNLLHLHISENTRFGIESRLVPANSDWEPPITRAELTEVVDYAAEKGIDVLGEIGMPGHMGAILTEYPHLALANHPDAIDITKPEALALCKALIEESLPLFSYSQWHIGGDEYLPEECYVQYPHLLEFAQEKLFDPISPQTSKPQAKDAKIWFMNQLIDWLNVGQTRARVWGDDIHSGPAVHLRRSAIVEWWADYSPLAPNTATLTPHELLYRGYQVVNCSWVPCYWVMSDLNPILDGYPSHTDADWIAKSGWKANHFQCREDRLEVTDPKYLPNIRGAKLQVWCDQPDIMRSSELLNKVRPVMQAIATQVRSTALAS